MKSITCISFILIIALSSVSANTLFAKQAAQDQAQGQVGLDLGARGQALAKQDDDDQQDWVLAKEAAQGLKEAMTEASSDEQQDLQQVEQQDEQGLQEDVPELEDAVDQLDEEQQQELEEGVAMQAYVTTVLKNLVAQSEESGALFGEAIANATDELVGDSGQVNVTELAETLTLSVLPEVDAIANETGLLSPDSAFLLVDQTLAELAETSGSELVDREAVDTEVLQTLESAADMQFRVLIEEYLLESGREFAELGAAAQDELGETQGDVAADADVDTAAGVEA